MRLSLWLVLIVVAVLSLEGCREAFEISVTQTLNIAPTFHLLPSSGAKNEGVEINSFAVLYRTDPTRPFEQIWVVATKSKVPVAVKEITYGVVPLGFEEKIPARPLVAGEIYEILSSRPGNVGGARFKAGTELPEPL